MNYYEQLISNEIWHENTISSFLALLEYAVQIKLFESLETVIILLDDLRMLLDRICGWAQSAKKKVGQSFHLFLSTIDLPLSCWLIDSVESKRLT